jgi:hypothetical protein
LEDRVANEIFHAFSESNYSSNDSNDPSASRDNSTTMNKTKRTKKSKKKTDLPKIVCPFQKIT